MRHCALVLSLLLLAGCGGDPPSEPAAAPTASPDGESTPAADPSTPTTAPSPDGPSTPSPETDDTAAPAGGASPSEVTHPTDVPSTVLAASEAAELAGVDPTGAVAGMSFQDVAGTNVVVLRRIESGGGGAALLADHVVWPNPREREVLREVRDGVEDCDTDWVADFVRDSLAVRDNDMDGYGEVEFAYELGCRGDVGSDELKLLVIEEGRKHILRGTTFSPFEEFEDPVPEPAVEQWPQNSHYNALVRFRTYAVRSE